MSNDVTIDLQENAPHRVAYDLAMRIAADEGTVAARRDRRYWLNLYANCRSVVVDGWTADDAMRGG